QQQPIEQRSIPITMGGRTVTASMNGGETESVELPVTAQQAAIPVAAPQPAESAGTGRFAGFGSRLRGAVPTLRQGTPPPEAKTASVQSVTERASAATVGGFGSRLRAALPFVKNTTEDDA